MVHFSALSPTFHHWCHLLNYNEPFLHKHICTIAFSTQNSWNLLVPTHSVQTHERRTWTLSDSIHNFQFFILSVTFSFIQVILIKSFKQNNKKEKKLILMKQFLKILIKRITF